MDITNAMSCSFVAGHLYVTSHIFPRASHAAGDRKSNVEMSKVSIPSALTLLAEGGEALATSVEDDEEEEASKVGGCCVDAPDVSSTDAVRRGSCEVFDDRECEVFRLEPSKELGAVGTVGIGGLGVDVDDSLVWLFFVGSGEGNRISLPNSSLPGAGFECGSSRRGSRLMRLSFVHDGAAEDRRGLAVA